MTSLAELAIVDEEGAIRARCAQVDDKLEILRRKVEKGGWDWDEFREMCDSSWIFHENGLEGVVLTYPEIRSAVDNKIVSDVSLLPMYQHIKDQKKCIDEARALGAKPRGMVKLEWLKSLHATLIQDEERGGEYRKDIPIHRTYFHEIADPTKIDQGLKAVITKLQKTKLDDEIHPIAYAADVHHAFMRVYPFSKFSGLLGRLLVNFVIERAGYLPAIIHTTERQRYYEALKGDQSGFRYFLCDVLEHAMDNALRLIGKQGA